MNLAASGAYELDDVMDTSPELCSFPITLPSLAMPGATVIRFSNATQFRGVFLNADIRGFGRVSYTSGASYLGFIDDSVPHGPFGLLEMTAGATYAGPFVNGIPHGAGVIRFTDGSVFRGHLSGSAVDGFGFVSVPAEGMTFAGQFQSGVPSGFGVLSNGDYRLFLDNIHDGSVTFYAGEFCDGEPDGFGVSLTAQVDNVSSYRRFNRFEGSFSAGQRNGSGVLFSEDSSMLIGSFTDDKKEGLFLYINGLSQIAELRIYSRDICLKTHTLSGIFFPRPWLLRNIKLNVEQPLDGEPNWLSVFCDFTAEFETVCKAGLQLSQTGRSVFPAPQKYPVIYTILSHAACQTIPMITPLVTDSRVSTPWITEAIARELRLESGFLGNIPLDSIVKVDDAHKVSTDPQRKATTINAESVPSTMGTSHPLSDVQLRFLNEVDDVKSCIISHLDLIRLIFCFYQSLDILTLEQSTRHLPYINKYSIFTQESLKEYLCNSGTENVVPLPSDTQISASLRAESPLDGLKFDDLSAKSHVMYENANADSSISASKNSDSPQAAVPSGSTGPIVPSVADVANALIHMDTVQSTSTPAGVSEKHNELLFSFLRAVSHADCISVFTLNRFISELFLLGGDVAIPSDFSDKNPLVVSLKELFYEQYGSIQTIVSSICKPSDEYIVANSLCIDICSNSGSNSCTDTFTTGPLKVMPLIQKCNDVDFSGFCHLLIRLAALLPQTKRTVPKKSKIAVFLTYFIEPFARSILSKITRLARENDAAFNTLTTLFVTGGDGKTPKNSLKNLLSKLSADSGKESLPQAAWGSNLNMQSLSIASMHSPAHLMRTPQSLQKTAVKDASAEYNPFEAGLMGSLLLVTKLTEILRTDSSILRNFYTSQFYLIDPQIWQTINSDFTILYMFSQLSIIRCSNPVQTESDFYRDDALCTTMLEFLQAFDTKISATTVLTLSAADRDASEAKDGVTNIFGSISLLESADRDSQNNTPSERHDSFSLDELNVLIQQRAFASAQLFVAVGSKFTPITLPEEEHTSDHGSNEHVSISPAASCEELLTAKEAVVSILDIIPSTPDLFMIMVAGYCASSDVCFNRDPSGADAHISGLNASMTIEMPSQVGTTMLVGGTMDLSRNMAMSADGQARDADTGYSEENTIACITKYIRLYLEILVK